MSRQQAWRNRIVGQGEEAPDQLLANPGNWRVHPERQQKALTGALNDLGWIDTVKVNQRTGHVVDGHLRVALAIRKGEASVPVTYLDLSEAEEAEALATFDPISAMAVADAEKLDALLRDVQSGEEGVQALLSELAQKAGVIPPQVEFPEYDESVENDVEYVECPNCHHKWPK